MKKLLIFLVLMIVLLVAGYVWLMSEGSPENADQTSVTKSLPLSVGQ